MRRDEGKYFPKTHTYTFRFIYLTVTGTEAILGRGRGGVIRSTLHHFSHYTDVRSQDTPPCGLWSVGTMNTHTHQAKACEHIPSRVGKQEVSQHHLI